MADPPDDDKDIDDDKDDIYICNISMILNLQEKFT